MPSEYPRLICVGRWQWLHCTGGRKQAPYNNTWHTSGGAGGALGPMPGAGPPALSGPAWSGGGRAADLAEYAGGMVGRRQPEPELGALARRPWTESRTAAAPAAMAAKRVRRGRGPGGRAAAGGTVLYP